MTTHSDALHGERGHPVDGIEQRPPRQDSLKDQLADLHTVASRLGMYDAADWLWKHVLRPFQ